ncbi:hypothetical protein ACFL0Y_03485 [Patescibacteria group bacterium]
MNSKSSPYDKEQAARTNKILEFFLLALLVLQVAVMGTIIITLLGQKITDPETAKEVATALPFWTAGLIPILVSRLKVDYEERKKQKLLVLLVLLAVLLLVGTTIFFWQILATVWHYL